MQPSVNFGTSPTAPASITEAVLALDAALERRLRYPETHPLVRASRGSYVNAWAAAQEHLGDVQLWVGTEQIGWGTGEAHAIAGPRFESIGRTLHAMHIASISVAKDASGDEVLELLDLIQSLRTDSRPFETIRRWEETNDRRVHIAALDVDGLEYSDNRPRTPSGEVWAGLGGYLHGDSEDPKEVARALTEMVEEQGPMAVSAVRASIMDSLNRADPGNEREVSRRIVRMLAALPDVLRAEVLRTGSPASSAMLARLVRPLGARDAVSALLLVGNSCNEIPKATASILSHILRCLPEGESLARDVFGTLSDEPADLAEVAEALRTVLEKRSDNDFNPEDYQQRLDELVRQENLSVDRSSHRAEALENTETVATQLGGIAALTLADALPEEVAANIAALDRCLPALMDGERLDLLAVGAQSLRAQCAENSEPLRLLADRLTANLARLISLGTAHEGRREELRALLALVKPQIVAKEALRLLLDSNRRDDGEALRTVLLDVDGPVLTAAISSAVEKSPDRSVRLRILLRDARSTEIRALIEKWKAHASHHVRLSALIVAVDRDGVAAQLDTLQSSLFDPDPEIRRWSLRRLASSPTESEDVTTTLQDLLALGGARLPEEISLRLADLLFRRGAEGARLVAGAVDTMRRKANVRSARLAQRLVQSLYAHRDDPEVAAVLRRWKWSLAFWVSRVPTWPMRANHG